MTMIICIWDRYKPWLLSALAMLSFFRTIGFNNILIPNYIAIFLTLLLVTAAYNSIRGLSRPLYIPDLEFNINFEKPDGSEVRIVRSQKMITNTPNITAYHIGYGPDTDKGGKIPKNSINLNILGDKYNVITEDKIYTGSERTRWDIIHTFDPPLPYVWWYDIIPLFLRKDFIIYKGDALYLDCFTGDQEWFEFKASHMHKDVKIAVKFPSNKIPHEFTAYRIKDVSVKKQSFYTEPGSNSERIYTVHFKDATNEHLRVRWKF